MAEREGFRTAFRGFHRQDVMDYMDAVQAEFSRREAGLREGLSEANACLSSLTEQNEALKTAASEAEKKAEDIRAEAFDRFEQMNAELLLLKKENEQLRARSAASAANAAATPASDAEELIAVIDELRARGTDFLTASGRMGEECLDEMDALIEAWEGALEQMRSKVGAARSDLNARQDAAGIRLSEMEAALKGEAPLTPVKKPTPAAPVAAPSVAPPAPQPQPQPTQSTQSTPQPTQPMPSSARLVSGPTRSREGWRRFLENLLG